MAKFTAAQFKKFGIKHIKEEDFKDDGTSFKVYECLNGIKFSYTTCNEDVYIAARDWYDNDLLSYDELNGAGLYNLADKFNGVSASIVDVNDIINTFERLKSGVEALEASVKDDNYVAENKDFIASKIEYEIEPLKSKRVKELADEYGVDEDYVWALYDMMSNELYDGIVDALEDMQLDNFIC